MLSLGELQAEKDKREGKAVVIFNQLSKVFLPAFRTAALALHLLFFLDLKTGEKKSTLINYPFKLFVVLLFFFSFSAIGSISLAVNFQDTALSLLTKTRWMMVDATCKISAFLHLSVQKLIVHCNSKQLKKRHLKNSSAKHLTFM